MAREVTATHERLRETEHNTDDPTPTHDVVAVSPEGQDLYVTDSYFGQDPSTEDPHVRFADEYSHVQDVEIMGFEVSHFEIRER